MVSHQCCNFAAQVHDRIKNAFAVKTPINIIPKQVKVVRPLDLQFLYQGMKRFTATMNIGNGVAHQSILHIKTIAEVHSALLDNVSGVKITSIYILYPSA